MTQAWRDVDREALCPRCHRLVSLQVAVPGDDVRLAQHPDQTGPCLGSQLALAQNAPLARAAGEVLQTIIALCEEALTGEATDWYEGLRDVRALAERSLTKPLPPQDRRPRVERLFAAALRNQQPRQPPEDPMHTDPERVPDDDQRPFEGPSAPSRPSAPGPSSPASPEDEGGGRPDPTP